MRRLVYGDDDPLVSVLTPTIKGRERWLRECVASVASQTLGNHEHLILLDKDRRGCSWTTNRLAEKAKGAWLFILADDDLLLPGCLEHLLTSVQSAGVIYSPPMVWGEDRGQFWGEPPGIPACALISAALWRQVGGYNQELKQVEDGDLWARMDQRGAIFRRVADQPTWVYRFWWKPDGKPGNKSRG